MSSFKLSFVSPHKSDHLKLWCLRGSNFHQACRSCYWMKMNQLRKFDWVLVKEDLSGFSFGVHIITFKLLNILNYLFPSCNSVLTVCMHIYWVVQKNFFVAVVVMNSSLDLNETLNWINFFVYKINHVNYVLHNWYTFHSSPFSCLFLSSLKCNFLCHH